MFSCHNLPDFSAEKANNWLGTVCEELVVGKFRVALSLTTKIFSVEL